MRVRRKRLGAVYKAWTAPFAFASNYGPATQGIAARHLVPFEFRTPVPSADSRPRLQEKIERDELPAFVLKVLKAYLAAVEAHGRGAEGWL